MLWECWLGLYDILPKFLYFMHSLSCDIKKMFCSDSSKNCSLMILKITALKAVIPGGTDGFWPQVNTSCFSYVWLLQPCFQWPAGLLWLWDFLSKNPGGGCHALLQGVFPTQGWNLHPPHLPHLLHCRWLPYLSATREDRWLWTCF